MYDVIIVGGGPAGLSAALILGRCRRSVMLCDDGHPRNGATNAVHGVFTRDGTPPTVLREMGREQLRAYPSVETRDARAIDVNAKSGGGFEVQLETGETAITRTVLLATGVIDELPDVEGFDDFYGVSIHHCPYCDGWEERDKPIGVYGQSTSVCQLALTMRTWSRDIAVFTDGFQLPAEHAEQMRPWRIPVYAAKIRRLEGTDRKLQRVLLESGETVERQALFFATSQIKRQRLAEKNGCQITSKGAVATDAAGETQTRGIYCAGDNTEAPQLVIVAAAEGAKAAVAINKVLTEQDLEQINPSTYD